MEEREAPQIAKTFFGDTSGFSPTDTAKDAGLAVVGILASNWVADHLPFMQNGVGQHAAKVALVGVALYAGGNSLLGPREARDLAVGAFILAGFEALSVATHGNAGLSFPGNGLAPNAAASQGVGNPPLITAGVTVPTTQGLGNNAAGVAAGSSNGTGL